MADAETGSPKIFDKPGKNRSDVWKYFGFGLDENTQKMDKGTVLCKTCYKRFTYTGNTSNLWSHVNTNHPQLKASKTPVQSAQTHMQQFSSTPLAFNSAKSASITNAIAEYLVLDMKPLATVDSDAFQHMFSKAEPRYKVPSRSYFKDSKIPNMYEATKTKVMADLKKSDQVALTTDCWTSNATQSYMTVTAHYITSNWELRNLVLQTRELECSHTADNLADALVKCVEEWQIIPPPVVVNDNAANIVKAVRTLGWVDIGCFAHTLNLAARAGLQLKTASSILGRGRSLVSYFKRSAVAMSVLKEKQNALSLPKHALINDVVTRWNSAYDMISRIVEQEEAIIAALVDKRISKDGRSLLFTEAERTGAEEILVVYRELKNATTLVSSATTTVALILPTIKKLETHLSAQEGDIAFTREIKNAVLKNLHSRYLDDKTREFLLLATILDPRSKSLTHISDAEKTKAKEILIQRLVEHDNSDNITLKQEPADGGDDEATLPDSHDEAAAVKREVPETPEEEPPLKRIKTEADSDQFVDSWLGDVLFEKEEAAPTSKYDRMVLQVERYLSDIAQRGTNPFVWWKDHEVLYPHVAALAKTVLCCPSTSVPSERVFSCAGLTVSKQRGSLSPENVDKLIFLNKNYKIFQ